MSLSRRSFLVAGALQVGSWLVEPSVARRILLAAESDARFLAVPVEGAKRILYYDLSYYRFSLDGLCLSDPDPVTLRYALEGFGVEPESPLAVWEFMVDHDYCDEDDDPHAAVDALGGLDSLITKDHPMYETFAVGLVEDWYNSRCPEAKAYRYLSELGLADPRGDAVAGLGRLEFCSAGMPGDGDWVQTEEITVVSGLQQRLIQLGESTEVRLCRS